MSVSPNDLLKLAKELLSRAQTEIELRNVISRAYYAAYHTARNFHDVLPKPGKLPPNKTGIHEELAHRLCWPTLAESDPRYERSRQIGRQLRWLHSERVQADYFLDLLIERDAAMEVIIRAEQLIAIASSS